MNLTGKQKRFLKSQAHHLDPIFQIGKNGVSEEMISQIGDALEKRELIKVSLLQNTFEDPKEAAATIAEPIGAEVVQVIGRVIVLFKEAKDEKNRRISQEI